MEGLPEGCISHILSLTSAQDACRSSAVSLDFQSAAGSDSVWEKFLPSDYNEIISDSVTPVLFSTKKELYASLCRSPILLRGGTKINSKREVGMEGLPEVCVSHILSLTSAQDACRSSAVSPDFQSAAGSDSVWETFLPSDYKVIVSDSVTPVHFSTKKALYATLCQSPILLRGGTKSFQLEKKSGKKCYMIGARELCICWGDTPEYWNWTSLPESRFPEVAQLKAVCWLDIKGVMRTEMLSPNTTYVAYFVFMVGDNFHGFENLPIEVSVRFIDRAADEGSITTACLHVPRRIPRHGHSWWSRSSIPQYGVQIEQARGDGWKEVKLGEFFNDGHGEVEMRLSEIRVLNWKTGLIVQGIELRPK